MSRTATRAPGRRASAAMPEMGYTCLICPRKPSVITGGSPGDMEALLRASGDGTTHLREQHAQVIADATTMDRVLIVSPRTISGPTEQPTS